ncbi:MAG: hypothetical protein JSS54_08205 [Proteobacteria bacterium]|nr:hypothetical protein [Pseudomonadota bacterium]
MKQEDLIVTSPLSRELDVGNQHLVICVFRGAFEDDDWLFEVVDSSGRTDISQEMYSSDQAALEAALQAIQSRG